MEDVRYPAQELHKFEQVRGARLPRLRISCLADGGELRPTIQEKQLCKDRRRTSLRRALSKYIRSIPKTQRSPRQCAQCSAPLREREQESARADSSTLSWNAYCRGTM